MTAAPDETPERPVWRLIVHGAADGAANMAIDEALLEDYDREDGPAAPTVRLYGWRPPALSLGVRQRATGPFTPRSLRAEGLDLVRRPTGGGAVIHDVERTYAVVGRLGATPFPGGVTDTYARIAGALMTALRGLEIEATSAPAPERGGTNSPLCFDSAGLHEITVGGRKLIGSAQLRRRRAFLQHGSILLRSDPERAGRLVADPGALSAATDLATLLGRLPEPSALDDALIRGFATAFGANLVRSPLDPALARRAALLRCWKYDSAAWTLEGRIGTRERRWGLY